MEIEKAKRNGYVKEDDGKTQFTIRAYHGCRRNEKGVVYQIAIEYSDGSVSWEDKKIIEANAKESLNEYFCTLNRPNPDLNKKNIKLR